MASTHNLRAVTCIAGTFALGGYKEDAAIQFERLSNVSESEVGASGDVTVNYLNDPRIRATISCQEHHVVNRLLLELYQSHQDALDAGNAVPDTIFLMEDPINGDSISDSQLHFEQVPTPSKGKMGGNREWILLLPNGASNMNLSALL